MKNTDYSVKNHRLYGLLLLALLLCGRANAKVNNYIGGYANVGEWSMLPSGSNYTGSLGIAGGVGFLYEMRAGETYSPTRFLLDVGVGAWGGMTSFMQSRDGMDTLFNQQDLQKQSFDYVYDLKGRQDRYNNVAVQVPLMIGVQHRRFYMLVGAKVNASVWTKTQTVAMLNTYGDYTRYGYGIFRNMPEYQFFENKPIQGGVKTSLNLDVDLSFEIGGRLGPVYDAVGYDVPKRKIEYRLAAFVDYGLLDIHTNRTLDGLVMPSGYNVGETAPVYNTTSMIDNLQVNDIMSTETTNLDGTKQPFAKSVNSLMVGIKFTVLFQLPEPGQCVICRDAYGTSIRSRRSSSRGMKYEE